MRAERRQTLEAPVRTEHDLLKLWRALMGTGGFGKRTLWLVFLDDRGYPLKMIVPIEDLDPEPDVPFVGNLDWIAREVAKGTTIGSIPVLLSRPGPAAMTAQDRRWAVMLRAHGGPLLNRWPLHLATTDRVQVFAPDDLIAA